MEFEKEGNMLLDFIIGLIFFAYFFFNCSLLVMLNRVGEVNLSIWKQVLIFLFGVFIDGLDNLKAAFKKW